MILSADKQKLRGAMEKDYLENQSILSPVWIMAIVVLSFGSVAGFSLYKKNNETSFTVSITPQNGKCGPMADVVREVAKFKITNPNRDISKMISKLDSEGRCVVGAEISHKPVRTVKKDPTLAVRI